MRFSISDDRDASEWLRALLPEELQPLGAANAIGRVSFSPEELNVTFSGQAAFNGVDSQAAFAAIARAGWLSGESVPQINASLSNPLVTARFVGRFGLTVERGLLVDGAYELRAPDVRAVGRWATASETSPLFAEAPLLESVDISGSATLVAERAAASVSGAVVYNAEEVRLSGELEGGSDWRSGGESRMTLDARAEGFFTLGLDGRLALDETRADPDAPFAAVQGRLTARTPNVARLRAWLDIAETAGEVGDVGLDVDLRAVLPEPPVRAAELTPDALLREAIEGEEDEAEQPWDGAELTTPFAQLRVDGKATNFAGSLAVDGDLFVVRGAVSVGPLDLTPFTTAAPQASALESATADIRTGSTDVFGLDAGNAVPTGWSTEPIDFSFLDGVDVEIDFQLDGLRAGPLELGALEGRVTAAPGRLALDAPTVEAFGGTGAIAVGFDATGATPTQTVSGRLRGAETRRMFQAVKQRSVAVGTIDIDVELAGAGASEAAIASSLDGRLAVASTNGTLFLFDFKEIAGGSLVGLFGARQLAPGVTPYDSLGSSFAISDGVARSDDLELTGPTISFVGGGVIEIGDRELDYAVRVTALGVGSVFDRVIAGFFPIVARGSWDAIKIGVEGNARASR